MPYLPFVKKVHEHDDVYSFHFEKPKSLRYKAGQHGIFFLAGLYRPHPFSLTSAPHQDFVSFTTKIREGSRFKQKLMQLKAGEKTYMFGPLMNFTFDSRYNSHVFLAQGVGITPFQSMLAHAKYTNLSDKITVVHVSKDGHSFKDITSELSDAAHFPSSSHEFTAHLLEQDPKSSFYISGSPAFIRATKKSLRGMGIPGSRIRTDLFLGY